MKKPGPSSFEATYPAITRWVREFGRIEIGQDDLLDNFVKAIDRGGMPWGGKSQYKSIDEALLAWRRESRHSWRSRVST